MSAGETKREPSGFTIDTLHAHIMAFMDEREKRYEQRFRAQEEADRKLEATTSARFSSVNEFRAALTDQTATFMPRSEAEQRAKQTEERQALFEQRASETFGRITSRLDLTAGRSSGFDKGWGYLVGALGTILAIIAIVLNVVRR